MHVLYEVVVPCALLCLTVTCSQQMTRESRAHVNSSLFSRRQRRTVNDQNPFQELVEALQNEGMGNAQLYMHYTPSTPSPDEIDCYVEVPATVRRGGRCIQLGGRFTARRTWACQAGLHLAISQDCAGRVRSGGSRRRG